MRSIFSLVLIAGVASADPDPWGPDAKRPPDPPPRTTPRPLQEMTDMPEPLANEFELSSGGQRVRFHMQLGNWSDSDRHDGMSFSPAWFHANVDVVVELGCQGECTPPALPGNIVRSARESFDFTKSKNHVPQLTPRWITKPHREKSGAFAWRYQASDKWQENTEGEVAVVVIPPGMSFFVSCRGKIDRRADWAWLDRLEKICREMTFEVVTP